MAVRSNGDEYFQELIIAPVAVVFYRDKVQIIERTGDVIERKLEPLEDGLMSGRVPHVESMGDRIDGS